MSARAEFHSADGGSPLKDTGGTGPSQTICPWEHSLTEKPSTEATVGPSTSASLKRTS